MARSDSEAVQPRLPSTYSSTESPKRSRSARTTAVSSDDRASTHLDLEGADAVDVDHPLGLGHHRGGLVEAEHVADPHPVGEAARADRADWQAQRAAERIPHGHVDGGLGGGVADGAGHSGAGDLAFQQGQPHELRGEDLLDHGDDAGLRLAVGERPRRRLGDPDDAVIGVHPNQHVLGGVHFAGGELQRFDIGDGEGIASTE